MNLSPKVLLGLLVLAFGAGAWLSGAGFTPTGQVTASPGVSFSGIQAAFCPSLLCVSLPVSAIDAAHARVWVAMYSFTNTDLRDALIRAKNRGVDVKVLLESQQASSQYSVHPELVAAGIPVELDTNPSLMHDKFAVLDDEWVITGSMNWTANGVKENNENVTVIDARELNAKYASEFQKLWSSGKPVGGS